MAKARISVLLADDHELISAGIRELLASRFRVVGSVRDGWALLEEAEAVRPDVVLMDLSMPGLDGLEATRRLRETLPEIRIVFLTMHDDIAFAKAAFEAGASGYLVKSSAPRELFEAIDQVTKGGRYLSAGLAGRMMSSLVSLPPQSPGTPLTPREVEVASLIGDGMENAEIGHRLFIAEVTVRTHYHRILQKLGIKNRVELARFALKQGWSTLRGRAFSNGHSRKAPEMAAAAPDEG